MAVLYLINTSYLAFGGGGELECKVHWPCIWGGKGKGRGETQAQVVKSAKLILVSQFHSFLLSKLFSIQVNFKFRKDTILIEYTLWANNCKSIGSHLPVVVGSSPISIILIGWPAASRPALKYTLHLHLGGGGGKGLECKVHWPCIWGRGGGGNPNASELAFFF